jgi:plastocyanin
LQNNRVHETLGGFAVRTRSISLTLAGLAFSAFALTACGSSSSSSPTAPTPQPATGGGGGSAVTISIANFAFSPTPVDVKVGQQVIWQNTDSVAHTATASAAGGFDTGNIAAGASSSAVTFSAPGTVQYVCKYHSRMVATLNVTQ